MNRAIIGLGLMGLIGCGSSGGGPGTSQPTIHTLDSGSGQVPAGDALAIGPWPLPSGATVTYTIIDTPTGIGSDTMDFVVASDAMVQAGVTTIAGYGVRNNVASTSATTETLPADVYDLVAICHNIIDDCIFTATITAYY